MTDTTRIKISTVIFDQTIYPRLSPDLSLIQKYRDAIDKLPPIVIDRKNMKREEEGLSTPDPNLHSIHDIRVFKYFHSSVMRVVF